MENKITEITENPAAMQLRLASREMLKNNKLNTDTWYKASFKFNVDEQNIVTVNDIKTEQCIKETIKVSEPVINEDDLREWVKEYERVVIPENNRLNTTDKVVKVGSRIGRSLNKFYRTKILTEQV